MFLSKKKKKNTNQQTVYWLWQGCLNGKKMTGLIKSLEKHGGALQLTRQWWEAPSMAPRKNSDLKTLKGMDIFFFLLPTENKFPQQNQDLNPRWLDAMQPVSNRGHDWGMTSVWPGVFSPVVYLSVGLPDVGLCLSTWEPKSITTQRTAETLWDLMLPMYRFLTCSSRISTDRQYGLFALMEPQRNKGSSNVCFFVWFFFWTVWLPKKKSIHKSLPLPLCVVDRRLCLLSKATVFLSDTNMQNPVLVTCDKPVALATFIYSLIWCAAAISVTWVKQKHQIIWQLCLSESESLVSWQIEESPYQIRRMKHK